MWDFIVAFLICVAGEAVFLGVAYILFLILYKDYH